jgi:hypothetical protein
MTQTKQTQIRKRNVKKVVKSVLLAQSELKYNVISQAPVVATTAGVVIPITQAIVQGDQTNQRNGNKIYLRRMDIRFNAQLPTLGLFGAIRLVMVVDHLNTGVLPATTDILNAASTTSPPSVLSTINKRFTFVEDKVFPLVVGGADQLVHWEWNKRQQRAVTYNGTISNTAANGKNAIFVLVITDLALNSPEYRFDVGVHYTDS